jgi:hypothetical protein
MAMDLAHRGHADIAAEFVEHTSPSAAIGTLLAAHTSEVYAAFATHWGFVPLP